MTKRDGNPLAQPAAGQRLRPALLNLRGAVGESLGGGRPLKCNTSNPRSQSLFRQACMLYDLILKMREHRLGPLMENFARTV